MSAGQGAPGPAGTGGHGTVIDGMASRAVDPFDLASHLESQGYGDRFAKADGFASVFDMANELLLRTEREAPRRPRMAALAQARDRLLAAVGRSVALVAGVVICLSTLGGDVQAQGMALAGGGAWLCAHLTSVVLWRGLSRSRTAAATAGLPVVLAGLVASGLVAAFVGIQAAAWIAWGCASAVLTVLVAPARPLVFAAVLSAAAGLTAFVGSSSRESAARLGLDLMLAAVIVAVVVLVRNGARLRGLPRGYARTLWLGVVQAGGQILAFVALLAALPPGTSTWVAIGGLVASALADPALEVVQILVRESVTRSTSWAAGHRVLSAWTIATVLSVVGVAGIAGAGVAWSAPLPMVVECGFGTAALAAVTVGVGALLRAGDARGAAVGATGAAVVMWLLALGADELPHGRPPLLLAAVVVCVAASVATTRRVLTHPALW